MIAPLIEVRNLRRYFGAPAKPVRAVDDVSFFIMPGETLGLVGESGSGKSTIGRTLLRLIESSSGQVLYRGEDLGAASGSRMRALRSKLQMIFQDPYASLNPKMRVKDILGEALQVHGLAKGKAARDARIAELLELVGPTNVERCPICAFVGAAPAARSPVASSPRRNALKRGSATGSSKTILPIVLRAMARGYQSKASLREICSRIGIVVGPNFQSESSSHSKIFSSPLSKQA